MIAAGGPPEGRIVPSQAPAEVVDRERARHASLTQRQGRMQDLLRQLARIQELLRQLGG
ncbi:MAG: hypothetical protein HYY00_04790 [Chloroflexi bacterium]|nr:hypothetical protein [Chloroflexota bacterium]